MEKAQWEQPVDGGAISERGRLEAAKNQVVVLQTMMKSRGCKEEFVPNQALLEQGQVRLSFVLGSSKLLIVNIANGFCLQIISSGRVTQSRQKGMLTQYHVSRAKVHR